ncbi:MAG: hypothetical protein AAF996_18840 [Pseudomonadota bacterium]
MRHAALLALAWQFALASQAQPNAAYQPELLFSADQSALCEDYTERVRSEFGFDPTDISQGFDRFAPAARHINLISTNIVRSPYQVTIDVTLFSGDIDGDGITDSLLTTMRGGQRAVGYQTFVEFTRLSAEQYRTARAYAKANRWDRRLRKEGKFIMKAIQLGKTTGGDPWSSELVTEPQKVSYPKDILPIVEFAFQYPEPLQIVEYDQRLYIDQPVISPLHPTARSVRTLISFDTEMRAKVECVVSTASAVKSE